MKKKEKLFTYRFYAYLYSPVFLSILLTCQAIKEKSFSIFADFWWIGLSLFVIFTALEYFMNFTEIDYEKKKVFLSDRLYQKVEIKENMLREIDSQLFCLHDNPKKSYNNPFSFYGKKSRKKIYDALLEFNPQVKNFLTSKDYE